MGAEVTWVPVAGIWVRQSRPNLRGDEAAAYSARWQRADVPAAYFADSEATAWAELYRGLAERGIAPGDVFPRDLHHVRVAFELVAELSTEKARSALGLPRIRQTSLQWPSFQAVGEQLVAEEAQGILYSSAARTRSLCLCVFEAGLPGLTIEGESVRVLAPPPPPRGLRT